MKEVVCLIVLASMSSYRLTAASFGMIFPADPLAHSAAVTGVRSTALPMEMFRGRPLSSESSQNRQTNSPLASPIPRLADQDISLLQDLARSKSTRDFLGISHYRDGRQKLYITSTRTQIAYKTAEAIESNTKYTPLPQDRRDTVSLHCGNSDPGDIFECSRVRVSLLNARMINPLSYSAKANEYKNALGARRVVREVVAEYSARDLGDGFLVAYTSFEGTESTFEVSCEDAQVQLLLKPQVIRCSNGPFFESQ
jgi:hypothetical protein